MTKIAMVCLDCGSDNISTSNVSAYWNVARQDWDYEHYDSGMYCSECGDDGGDREIEYFSERFGRSCSDFEAGDVVKFEKDMLIYSQLTGHDKIPEDREHNTLAVVIDETEEDQRAKTYGNIRDTVLVRLFTGELIEVWPRDIYKFGGNDE